MFVRLLRQRFTFIQNVKIVLYTLLFEKVDGMIAVSELTSNSHLTEPIWSSLISP